MMKHMNKNKLFKIFVVLLLIVKVDGKTVYVITNHHVIENAQSIEVIYSNGESVRAECLGSDEYGDIAVLKMTVNFDVSAYKVGDSDLLEAGEPVLAVGSPLGIEYAGTVTQGIVSAPSRTVSVDLNDDGDTTNDWKIFYAENGNTFIIAADYLLYDKVPENAETREITGDGYDYSVRWLDPSNNGSTDISSSVADKFKFTWLDEGRESDEGNIKVATVLLNTSIWSEFASGIEGAEAIGTPTLEMFIASWNQKYSDSKLYYAINEENDYLVGNTENPTTAQVLMNTSEGYNDELYYPHQEDYHNCWGYWLVAPNSTRYLMTVEYGGSIMATTGYNNDMEVSSCLESLWYRNSSSCMFTFNSKRSK